MADKEAHRARIEEAKAAAVANAEFSDAELERAVRSLRDLAGPLAGAPDWAAYQGLLAEAAHLSHKDWAKTGDFAQRLANFLPGPDSEAFRAVFQRALEDGQWDAASAAAEARAPSAKPWAVLVTGLNGIRKTSAMYEKWFKEVLSQALAERYPDLPPKEELPAGADSFFRQLDYIIATAANEEFRELYTVDDIELYAMQKDLIFARYRMVAEMWGVLLVREAQKKRLNVMVETSGRDIAMFKYVDQFFPDSEYRKLVINFQINEIGFAEKSVDTRMEKEMRDGRAASEREPIDVVRANAGGPYGSKVLAKVQEESNKVWSEVLAGGKVSESWYKASIFIDAREGAPWTVRAGGAESESFEFAPR